MSFKFIDYSDTYFTTIAKKPIPSKRSGKFVQIINHSSNELWILSCLTGNRKKAGGINRGVVIG